MALGKAHFQDEKQNVILPAFDRPAVDNYAERIQETHKKRKTLRPFVHIAVLILLSILLLSRFTSIFRFHAQTNINADGTDHKPDVITDFRDISPSTSLEWTPCFGDDFLCARLQVPMDYNRSLSQSAINPTVEIAIAMLPGKGHATSGKYSVSPLLLNPGGPGGSGVGFVLGLGRAIQQMVGDEYDIISFDPRGIGFTTPTADCFSFPLPGNTKVDENDIARGQFNRLEFAVSNEGIGLVNSSQVALTKRDNAARALSQLCEKKDGLMGKDSIFRYLDTPTVARDMASIIDAWDSWRDASLDKQEIQTELEAEDSTKGKLVYIGFSYGTLLGATFASMFPNRVGRIILDGVVDADYYVSPLWSESIEDADAVLDSFFTYCAEAGPNKCQIARAGDSARDIKQRAYADIHALKKHSLIGVNQATNTPSVITWDFLKGLLFASLYSPVGIFPVVASVLNFLHMGQYELLHLIFPQLHSLVTFQPYCLPHLPNSFDSGDAQFSIMCADKRYPLNESVPHLEERFENMSRMSSFADVWMSAMVGCDGWAIEPAGPPMRWDDHPAHKPKPIKTSFPLLFISNSYDPVTPLRSGVKMAGKFQDAGLIEQRSGGHCSIAAISTCTIMKMRAYIKNGKVPPPPKLEKDQELRDGEWERCDADEWPWHPVDDSEEILSLISKFREDIGHGDAEEKEVTLEEANQTVQTWKAMQRYLARSEHLMGNPNRVLSPGLQVYDFEGIREKIAKCTSGMTGL